MPKGHKTAKTLVREAELAALRQTVMAHAVPMVEAQVANAMGIKYLVRRDKSGKFTPLSEAQFKAAIDAGEAVELYEKIPNVSAFTDLMDRTFGRPEQPVAIEHSGTIDVVGRLAEARKRLNEAKNGRGSDK